MLSTGWERFVESLKPGTSDVDWCEPNFVVSPYITEYYNTVSNVLYIIFPPVMIYLFRDYSRHVSQLCNLVWVLLMVVGVGSAYFHGALSLAGQLIDELAILWLFAAVLALWVPKYLLPQYFITNKNVLKWLVLVVTVLLTWMGCLYPVVNHVVLMCSSVPIVMIVYTETRHSTVARVRWLGVRCCVVWGIAFTCWISDRAMCGFWLQVNFPYLHSIWHTIMAFGVYDIILFLAYKDTEKEYRKLGPELRVWPRKFETLGVMYMSFKSPLPVVTDKNYNKVQ